jgi:hypothetical protein
MDKVLMTTPLTAQAATILNFTNIGSEAEIKHVLSERHSL